MRTNSDSSTNKRNGAADNVDREEDKKSCIIKPKNRLPMSGFSWNSRY